MMHASSAMSTASDETPIMSNSNINSAAMSSSSSAASSTAGNGSDPLSSSNTTTTTSRTGSMRRAAAMAAASALSSMGRTSSSSSRPSSPPRSSPKDNLNQTSNGTSNSMMNGPQGRRQRSRHHRDTPADHFHPRLITAQILSLQCFHYAIQGLFFQINYLLYKNSTITIDRIFTDQYVKLWHVSGWPDVAAIFLSALTGSVLLAVIVEKSKKCLDFCVTYFLLHLMLSTWYGGHMPRTTDWWIVHLAATILMVLVGEYVCSRKELSDIPLLEI